MPQEQRLTPHGRRPVRGDAVAARARHTLSSLVQINLRDALYDDGFEHHWGLGLVLAAARNQRNLGDDLLTLDDFAEDGVVAREVGRGRDGDEELAAIGSGAAVGHGQLARLVELVRRSFGLVLEAIAGSAHAGARGVAALDHEVGNHAMEDGAVEELVSGLFVG